jgi:hypothetical protein
MAVSKRGRVAMASDDSIVDERKSKGQTKATRLKAGAIDKTRPYVSTTTKAPTRRDTSVTYPELRRSHSGQPSPDAEQRFALTADLNHDKIFAHYSEGRRRKADPPRGQTECHTLKITNSTVRFQVMGLTL